MRAGGERGGPRVRERGRGEQENRGVFGEKLCSPEPRRGARIKAVVLCGCRQTLKSHSHLQHSIHQVHQCLNSGSISFKVPELIWYWRRCDHAGTHGCFLSSPPLLPSLLYFPLFSPHHLSPPLFSFPLLFHPFLCPHLLSGWHLFRLPSWIREDLFSIKRTLHFLYEFINFPI